MYWYPRLVPGGGEVEVLELPCSRELWQFEDWESRGLSVGAV